MEVFYLKKPSVPIYLVMDGHPHPSISRYHPDSLFPFVSLSRCLAVPYSCCVETSSSFMSCVEMSRMKTFSLLKTSPSDQSGVFRSELSVKGEDESDGPESGGIRERSTRRQFKGGEGVRQTTCIKREEYEKWLHSLNIAGRVFSRRCQSRQ